MSAKSCEAPTRDVRQAFQEDLPLPAGLDHKFENALRHLLRHPGSMVRPRMAYQVARAYGISEEHAIDLGVALEYFHTASLVFDDLPCMDNAMARRGAPCVHVRFGEAGAMLAALGLINRAYALTWRAIAGAAEHIESRAMRYVEERLGVEGLLNGQSLDLNYASLPHTRETTERIAREKTVSLIRLTLVLPAIVGRASNRELQLFERMATCWGLSYQIVDDLKDVLVRPGESDKTAARDLHLDRPNIAIAVGISAAVKRLKRLIRVGDGTLHRLLKLNRALGFLATLRSDLQAELSRITENAYEIGAREHS